MKKRVNFCKRSVTHNHNHERVHHPVVACTQRRDELWTSDKIITVSDGSLAPLTGRATYDWVLRNGTETPHAKLSSDIWTNPKCMSSFRAELEGIYDMLTCARKAGNANRKFEIHMVSQQERLASP